MGYFSVAIILYKDIGYKYLVFQNDGISYFLQHKNSAIGAYFDFDTLINFIEKKLGLENLRKNSRKEFLIEREYQGRDKPACTVYKFILFKNPFKDISSEINAKWLSIDELKEVICTPSKWEQTQLWILNKLLADEQTDKFLKTDFEDRTSTKFEPTSDKSDTNKVKNIMIHNHHNDSNYVEELRNFFKPQERLGEIRILGDALPGQNIDDHLHNNLLDSDLILFILSSNYLACDQCDFFTRKVRQMEKKFVPILAKQCHWEIYYNDVKILPINQKPINSWNLTEEAYAEIVKEVYDLVKNIQN